MRSFSALFGAFRHLALGLVALLALLHLAAQAQSAGSTPDAAAATSAAAAAKAESGKPGAAKPAPEKTGDGAPAKLADGPATKTGDATPTKAGDAAVAKSVGESPIRIPADLRFYIVLLVIALMGGLFYVLFRWQHQIEQSAFFSGIYTDAVKRVEVMRMAGPTLDKWQPGDYLKEIFLDRSERGRAWSKGAHARPTFDASLKEAAQALGMGWEIERIDRSLYEVRDVPDGASVNPFARDWGSASASMRGSKPASTSPAMADGDAQAESDEQRCRKALAQFDSDAQRWVRLATAQALDWYQEDFAAVEQAAADRAKLVLNVDFSALRGRGPEFVLEFTAVVVIIFAAVILGVLGVLDSNQIGTLLAAIAGYVLGKGTARGGSTPAAANPAPAAGAGAGAGSGAGAGAGAGKVG